MSRSSTLRFIWGCLAASMAVGPATGVVAALFLRALTWATAFRIAHPSVAFALPLAGLLLGVAYQRYGLATLGGTRLVLHTLRCGGPKLPARMAPLVFAGTVWSHFFGASVGREGTALQLGGSIADSFSERIGAPTQMRQTLLASGVAAGFGALFGTPAAGAVFAIRLLPPRTWPSAALPIALSSFIADRTAHLCGATHSVFAAVSSTRLGTRLVLQWCLLAIALALCARAFSALTESIKRESERWISYRPWRTGAGGLLLVAAWQLSGTANYLGLGVATIERAVGGGAVPSYAWALKLVMTAVSVGSGFIGGEVTPLFFVGATLGNCFATLTGAPPALAAAIAMVGLFGVAARSPLAVAVMAAELFGVHVFAHALFVSALACLWAGEGIYAPLSVDEPAADGEQATGSQ